MSDDMRYTTRQVAEMLHVTSKTVCKWCDTGMLLCSRISERGWRYVTRSNLVAFAREHGLVELVEGGEK